MFENYITKLLNTDLKDKFSNLGSSVSSIKCDAFSVGASNAISYAQQKIFTLLPLSSHPSGRAAKSVETSLK